jgi:arylsulfatase A-like enzyme
VRSPNPRLIDVAPTVLSLFGVPVPDYMDGKPWVITDSAPAPPAEPQRESFVEVAT